MTEISKEAKWALHELRAASRTVQSNSDVRSSRKINDNATVLEQEIRRLEQERLQLLAQVTTGRNKEQELEAEITDLRAAREEAEDVSLPEDYWETAQ